MPNNVYRFRRIKWGDPKRFKAMPGASRPSTVGRNGFAIVMTVVVIGAVLLHLT